MLALIYDVHGNLPALEAVLDDAREQGADGYLVGGDVALFGPWPEATTERLRELAPATWIRGNGERWTADPQAAPELVRGATAAARDALGDALVGELADRVAEEHLLLGEAGRSGGGGTDAHGGHPSSAAAPDDARGRNVRGDIGNRCA